MKYRLHVEVMHRDIIANHKSVEMAFCKRACVEEALYCLGVDSLRKHQQKAIEEICSYRASLIT